MSSENTPVKRENGIGSEIITKIAILAAFSLFLSTVEYMIPKPLPFLRIGLANLPIMVGLALFSLPEYLILVTLKIAGQGLINGTLFSYIFIYSAGGSLASSLMMYLLYKLFHNKISYIGISLVGAMTSNSVQLLLAQYLLFGSSIWIIAPPFLLMGLVSSILLGIFVNHFTDRSRWYSSALEFTGLYGKRGRDEISHAET